MKKSSNFHRHYQLRSSLMVNNRRWLFVQYCSRFSRSNNWIIINTKQPQPVHTHTHRSPLNMHASTAESYILHLTLQLSSYQLHHVGSLSTSKMFIIHYHARDCGAGKTLLWSNHGCYYSDFIFHAQFLSILHRSPPATLRTWYVHHIKQNSPQLTTSPTTTLISKWSSAMPSTTWNNTTRRGQQHHRQRIHQASALTSSI